MKIEFMIDNNDEGRRLCVQHLPAVPREGEIVELTGPQYGESYVMLFKVNRVIYQPSEWMVDDNSYIQIWLEPDYSTDPREPWRPFCVCEKRVDIDGECDNCGDTIPKGT